MCSLYHCIASSKNLLCSLVLVLSRRWELVAVAVVVAWQHIGLSGIVSSEAFNMASVSNVYTLVVCLCVRVCIAVQLHQDGICRQL
jgi:hypothetical protein